MEGDLRELLLVRAHLVITRPLIWKISLFQELSLQKVRIVTAHLLHGRSTLHIAGMNTVYHSDKEGKDKH
jgi:hypothetical protein